MRTVDLRQDHEISAASVHGWKSKSQQGGASEPDGGRESALEELISDLSLNREALKVLAGKAAEACQVGKDVVFVSVKFKLTNASV